MFNRENSQSNGTEKKTPSINMISEGTNLNGDIDSENDLRVSGSIKGEARSKGRIVITSAGKIEGNVHAMDGDIAGNLKGEVFISEKLILRKSAVIDGDIHTKKLLVEEGAQINGNCKMGASAASSSKMAEYSDSYADSGGRGAKAD